MNLKPVLTTYIVLVLSPGSAIAAQSESATEPSLNLDPISQYVKRDIRDVDYQAQGNSSYQTEVGLGSDRSNFGKAVGDASASSSAAPKWNEPARIEKISSVDGAKVYKITTPLGSYCVRNKGDGSRQKRVPCTTFSF